MKLTSNLYLKYQSMDQSSLCSYQGCSKNFLTSGSFVSENLTCPHCKNVPYCSAACQEMDWIVHKQVCRSQLKKGTQSSTTKSGRRKPEDFEIMQNRGELGQGSFGTVMLVRDRANGQLFAMKIVPFFSYFEMQKAQLFKYCSIENLKREIKIQRKLDHPHITKLYSYFEDKENVYLILEYADKGSLYHTLKKRRTFSEQEAFVYFFQTCLGIDYLHKKNIIHRDLKPENLLLDKFGNVKICDFGWSTDSTQNNRNTLCGTVEYMPPEMIKKESHNFSLDVWGLGVLLFELLHGKPPFTGKTDQEKQQAILNQSMKFSSSISQDAVQLIKYILNPNPRDRPSIRQIFSHKWMIDKQKEHRINLLEYLWDDGSSRSNQSASVEAPIKKNISISHHGQRAPEKVQANLSKTTHEYQSSYRESPSEKQFSTYSYTSSRQLKSVSPAYSKGNLSTADLVTLYSKNNRKNTATVSDPETDIQSINLQQRTSDEEQKKARLRQLESLATQKQHRERETQLPSKEQGFFEKLFTTLGCLNRDREKKDSFNNNNQK